MSQFDLGAAAVEVMKWSMHSEVGVSLEKVREKAQSDGVGHEFAGKGDQLFFGARHHAGSGFEIAPGKSLEHGHPHPHFA